MKKKIKIRTLGIQMIALLFLANLTGSYFWVKTRTMAAACIDPATISTDSRCLYILTGKVFEMGSRSNPHRGHQCGMDVTSILPGNHSANLAKYLDPRYRADLCVIAAPTNTPVPTNTPIPTNTLAPAATNTPKPTNTPIPQATNTPKPTNTSIPQNTNTPIPTIPGAPSATNTPVPTKITTPKATNTPKPTSTKTASATATITNTPTSTVITSNQKCSGTDLNNDGIVNSMDYIICLNNEVTPTPETPTGEPTVVVPTPTVLTIPIQTKNGAFTDLGFAAWWGVVLAMASAGTLASTLALGIVKAMSNTIMANLGNNKYKPIATPIENNQIITRGDIHEKLYYATNYAEIDSDNCWINLSGDGGLVLGKLNRPKITEGYYKVSGFTVTSSANRYISVEKIVPLEKSG